MEEPSDCVRYPGHEGEHMDEYGNDPSKTLEEPMPPDDKADAERDRHLTAQANEEWP